MILIDAAKQGKVVNFVYDGKVRVVEVHAVGLSTAGKLVMRGYQVAGLASRPVPGWSLFDVTKIELPVIKDVASEAPRPGYKRGDAQMSEIFYEL